MPRPMGRPVARAKNTKKALKDIAGYAKKYWAAVLVALLCAAGSAVLAVLGPDRISELTAVIEAGISAAGINIDFAAVTEVALTLIAIYAASMILSYVQQFIMNYVSCNVGRQMRTNISRKINKVPLKYFDTVTYFYGHFFEPMFQFSF